MGILNLCCQAMQPSCTPREPPLPRRLHGEYLPALHDQLSLGPAHLPRWDPFCCERALLPYSRRHGYLMRMSPTPAKCFFRLPELDQLVPV